MTDDEVTTKLAEIVVFIAQADLDTAQVIRRMAQAREHDLRHGVDLAAHEMCLGVGQNWIVRPDGGVSSGLRCCPVCGKLPSEMPGAPVPIGSRFVPTHGVAS